MRALAIFLVAWPVLFVVAAGLLGGSDSFRDMTDRSQDNVSLSVILLITMIAAGFALLSL